MGKFSSTDIIRICNKYLSDDAITFDDVALSYGVSRSTITKNIYRGIVMVHLKFVKNTKIVFVNTMKDVICLLH